MSTVSQEASRLLSKSASVPDQASDCEDGAESTGGHLRHSQSFLCMNISQKTWRMEDSYGKMSAWAFIVNMLADLCPGGMLPLAYGLNWAGYAPAVLFLFGMCALSIYTIWMIAQTAEITGQKTWKAQWETVISSETAWMPVTVLVLFCFGCNLLYSVFFADLLAAALPPLGIHLGRDQCLVLFTLFPLLPLCFQRDLSALTLTSSLSMLMIMYTAFMTCLRAVDGTYVDGGAHYESLREKPSFPRTHMYDLSGDSWLLMSFLSLAFLSHYNGNKYYRELEGHTPKRFAQCTSVAMGISGMFYGVMMFAGYYTFGRSAGGVILDNYAPRDMLANIARVGIAFSMLASFPIMFSGLREAVVDLILIFFPSLEEDLTLPRPLNVLNFTLLIAVTICAVIFTNVVEVVSLVGAVCGSALIYIMPSLLYVRSLEKFLIKEEHALEIAVVKSTAVFGILIMVSALYFSLRDI